MNENQNKTSEYIASKIMRGLAILGLITLLVLVAWLLVQGSQIFPKARENIQGLFTKNEATVVNTVTEEKLVFEDQTQTIAVDTASTIRWQYTGSEQPRTYTFSYSCGTDTTVNVMQLTGWTELRCDMPYVVEYSQIEILVRNTRDRFADIELKVEAKGLHDSRIVTIVNTMSTSTASTTQSTSTPTVQPTTSNQATAEPAVTPVVVTKPPVTVPSAPKPAVPAYKTPAKLLVSIQETGIVSTVNRKEVFFPVSPIPSNKTAAVVFTVANKGDTTSGQWLFTANLPTEGDKDYAYTSPVQAPLLPGMEVAFTLSFDNILDAKNGTIAIEIASLNKADLYSDKNDSVSIRID